MRSTSAQKYVVGLRLKLTPATYSTHVTLRLTAEEHLELTEAGGSAFIRAILQNTKVYPDLTKDGIVKVVSTPKFHLRKRAVEPRREP